MQFLQLREKERKEGSTGKKKGRDGWKDGEEKHFTKTKIFKNHPHRKEDHYLYAQQC